MRKGFTLVEILIVVAIIALLAGLALPGLRQIRLQGDIAKAKSDLRTIQTALEDYYIHHDLAYPSLLSDLTSATPRIVYVLQTDVFNSGSNYGYSTSSNGDYYIIYSIGSGGNGSATVDDDGVITEVNPDSCVYVSNAGEDALP